MRLAEHLRYLILRTLGAGVQHRQLQGVAPVKKLVCTAPCELGRVWAAVRSFLCRIRLPA